MSIKSGQFLHAGNGVVIDRIQTGGVSSLNIPQEKVYELGNYQSVATVYDTPQLQFDMESLDVSTEVEALLLGLDSTATSDGDEFDFNLSMPLDIISPFKSAKGQFDIVKGIAVPYLILESATYRFGVGQNSTQSFSLRGDTINYIQGSPYYQQYNITSGTNQAYTFTHTAQGYVESGDTLYALALCAKNTTTGISKRLFIGQHYTNTNAGFTVAENLDSEGYDTLHVVYGSTVAATYSQAVHQNVSVKPAAVRGKDVEVYISNGAATPTLVQWGGVQSVEVDRRVTLDVDQELGNPKYVSQDYDVADVSGNLVLKPLDPADLWTKIAQVADVTTSEIAGALTTTPLEMEILIKHPDTGSVLKTIYVPDARFTIPGAQGQVQQKLTVTFPFTSDGGNLLVYKGER